MRNAKCFTTLWLLAMSLLVPGMAGAQGLGPLQDIQNDLGVLQDKLPPTWSQNLPASERFVVLADFNNEAVLDRETGLVWDRSSGDLDNDQDVDDHDLREWVSARAECTGKTVGGRKGWRLPAVHELASLVDPSVPSPGLTLPAGHPFSNAQPSIYWSATTAANNPDVAWFVIFSSFGQVTGGEKLGRAFAWCVRGGSPGPDRY